MKLTHHSPVRILMDTDCIKKNASALAPFGFKALIVTGRHSAKANGALDEILNALGENGQEYAMYDKVMANPSIECVYEGAEIAWKEQADFIIAIGGGSPMDAAKAICLLSGQDLKRRTSCLPVLMAGKSFPWFVFPLPPGTGSEVTQYSILTDNKLETKRNIATPLIFPSLAFLDAKYLIGLPNQTAVNTAIDALSHSVEGMLSIRADILSDLLAEKGVRLIASCLSSLEKGILETKEREQLLLVSTIGGMVISSTGTTAVHALGYALTYHHHVDHGKANGLLLVSFLTFVSKERMDIIERILQALGLSSLKELQKKLEKLLGPMPELTEEQIKLYAKKAFATKNIDNCIVRPSEADLRDMLKTSK
ncbi:iron-containing alcohol dehydrogenase family protein [uncultured Sphaerochaeta sp.]|uniref:iron-containing alcohol dehydrogenase family protein n=1 Tax=uncultured Sphaerochaeta sp. TaxID=886478 RepID=UPI002A0A5BC9|nr:iron-containing alcohol dehydrogenase family protein [uncultured Sphaerochaeta sp.]